MILAKENDITILLGEEEVCLTTVKSKATSRQRLFVVRAPQTFNTTVMLQFNVFI